MKKTIIAFGCNIGNCPETFYKAIEEIKKEIIIRRISSLYLTPAYGVRNQPDFYNAVLLGYTILPPYKLLNFLKKIEKKLGRKLRCRWCEREIDLDIIYYENYSIRLEDLIIPHKDRLNRLFVLLPLSEIEPAFIDSITQRPIKTFIKKLLKWEKSPQRFSIENFPYIL